MSLAFQVKAIAKARVKLKSAQVDYMDDARNVHAAIAPPHLSPIGTLVGGWMRALNPDSPIRRILNWSVD